MWLALIISVAVGLWIAMTLVVITLCRASARSDDAMDAALARAIGESEPARSPSSQPRLRTLSLDHAATLLGVRTHTLLEWGERYGFPTASPAEHRYSQAEVLALRDSLEDGLSIASAVFRARERCRGRRAAPATRLIDRRDGGLAS